MGIFKFIREEDRYHRDLHVLKELHDISMTDPSISGSQKDEAAMHTAVDAGNRMHEYIGFLTDQLTRSQALNVVLGVHLVGFYYILIRK